MRKGIVREEKKKIPERWRRFLWSYDVDRMDIDKNKKTIIIQVVNYGDLDDWRSLIEYYGREEFERVLKNVVKSEIKPRTKRLLEIMFRIKNENNARRGTY